MKHKIIITSMAFSVLALTSCQSTSEVNNKTVAVPKSPTAVNSESHEEKREVSSVHYFKTAQYALAEKAAIRELSKDPSHLGATQVLAEIFASHDQHLRVEDTINSFLRNGGQLSPDLMYRLAWSKLKAHHYQEALSHYENYFEMLQRPKLEHEWLEYGVVLYANDQVDRAESVWANVSSSELNKVKSQLRI